MSTSAQPQFVNPSGNLQSAMNWSAFALMLAPTILQLVATIQGLASKKAKGASKAKAVQGIVKAAAPDADPAVVQAVIDSTVQGLKDIEHPLFAPVGTQNADNG